MSGYTLAVDAGFDLDEIWAYIARDKVDAADRWIAKLFDAFESLAQAPGIGHERKDLTDLRVYAIRNGTRLRLVIVNVDNPANSAARPVAFTLPASYHNGSFYRLSAPSLTATSGISLGGHSVSANGTFAGPAPNSLRVNGKTLSVSVPAGTATVISLTP